MENIKIISSRLSMIQKDYSGSVNFAKYKSSISNATEEMIEAMTFMYFIMNGKLLTYRRFIRVVETLVEGALKEDDKIMENGLNMLIVKEGRMEECDEFSNGNFTNSNSEKIADSNDKNYHSNSKGDVIDTSSTKDVIIHTNSTNSTNNIHITFIYEGDYFMGLFDLTGEIMRYTISNLMDGERTQLLEMLEFMEVLYKEIKTLFYMYPDLNIYQGIFNTDFNGKGCMSIRKKLEVFKSSLDKVEQTVCEVLIRGEEMGPIEDIMCEI